MNKQISKKIKKVSKVGKVGKIIERSTINRKQYNISFCNGIKTKKNLLTKFEHLKDIINITKSTKTDVINIIPYCGEHVKISKSLDKVNESAIELDVVNSIESTFNTKIVSNFIDSGITLTNTQYTSFSDSQKFKNIIENKKTRDMILNGKKHALIIVHSNFLKDITKLYGNKIACDNLDIIQIIINKNNIRSPLLYIRKFSEYYNNPIPINTELTYNINLLSDCTNIFLMRHCVACHNIINKVGKSRFMAHILKKIKGELGYSLYSICSPYTVNELINKKTALLKLFDTTCGGLNNIQFGSSVIFRAILTSVLVAKILN